MRARFTQVSTAHASLVELLRARAFAYPDRRAYAFLADGISETESLTYGQLDARARAIGAALARMGARGERVLLLYPPGLEFIAAFFGCLYAGAVAVPCYPPRPRRDHPRLRAIARDARPRVALTTPELWERREAIVEQVPELAAAAWLVTAGLEGSMADGWEEPDLAPGTSAFLQYTSGSTATPKGVIVTHGNVLHNEEMIRLAFGQSEASVVVGWLPLYHDMGLIGNVLQPLYAGATSILMPPVAFLQRPARWLEAVSRYKATTSGGPNFAYDLCVRKIAPEDRARLDLSSWSLAFNGAEPVRAETLERFAAAFAPCGFRREAFYPCYGLAEATLFVAGSHQGAPATVAEFDAAALEQGRALPAAEGREGRILVSSGRAWSGQRIAIAGPESQPLPPGRVGEIWVAGPSVAHGYWGRTEETAQAFGAFLADGDGPFLRTGDLGFLWGGELFVTGRLKDLVILRGRNLYPQDVELTAERSHPALEPGAGAAFSADVRGEERLVVVHEVGRRFLRERGGAAEVAQAVRRAVAEEHEAQVYEVVLIRTGSLPKTSSGKVQRHACRAAWLAGELDVVGRDAAQAVELPPPADAVDRESLLRRTLSDRRAAVADFLLGELARVSGIAAASLDLERPATDAGLDSLAAVELGHRIESALRVSLPLTRWLEAPTLADLAEDIVDRLEAEPVVVEAGTVPEIFPLSHGQRGLFFLERLAPESAAYNIAVPVRLAGDLDVQALQRALLTLAERHPALRTTFEEIEGEPWQRAHPVLAPEFSVEEWSEGALEREAYRPFDLSQGPLLRAKVFQGDILILVVHHLVADFWSLALMARELGALYHQEALPALAATYADHVERERRLLAGPAGEHLWAYWKDQLSGEVQDLDLPTDRPRPPFQSWRGGSVALPLGADLSADLAALARRQGVTLFAALLAGFEAVLHRWTGQDGFVVGSPSASRSTADLASVVGYFVNALPLRADLAGDPGFQELLGRVGETVSGALAHDAIPFPLLAERLRPERDPARSPLFQAMLVFQRSHRPEERAWGAFALGEAGARAELLGLPVESIALAERRVPFDLTLTVAERGAEGLIASLQYVSDLFDRATAARLTSHLRTLLAAAVADPGLPLSELPLLSDAERRQLLEWGSGAAAAPATETLLHELFEAQAARTPEAVALVAGEERLTYRELDAWAESLAARLRALGVGPEERVGLCSRRSAALVAGLLAILKAGGAYVSLDPAHPRARLARILADSRPLVLLVEEKLEDVLPEHGLPVIDLAQPFAPPLPGRGAVGRERGPRGENLAYLIYTSGSTGEPKGVAIRHAAAVSLIRWAWSVFPDADLAGVLFSTSIGFDLSVFELFAPLSRGGAVVLAENALALPSLPAAGEVTLVNTVPSAMAGLLRLGSLPESLRVVSLAGEPLTRELAGRIHELPQVERVFNLYGPSEDTTYSTFARIGRGPRETSAPSIGRPVTGTRALVVDCRFHLSPQGVPGELWLGGAGLARGYFGRPDLTAERWVPDPFSGLGGERLYRTGDLVRFRSDGELEFLGRIDQQVKVRGFRVEPGEIEAALVTYPGVHESAVVALGEGGERSLAAFVVLRDERLDMRTLRSLLQERLPAHMVPSTFTALADLPRTATGKVDRKALVRTAPERPAEPSASPRGPIEELVAGFWTEMLGIEKVGAHDDFFSLGGHSLLALQVVARLRETVGVDLPLRAVFARPTVAGVAAEVEAALRGGLDTGEPALVALPRHGEDAEPLPASFSQEQLWLFDRLRPGSAAYNLPVVIRLLGSLEPGKLAGALERLARRHEALRTTLETGSGGRLFQRVHPPAVTLPGIDLTALPAAERASEAARLAALEARRPFDLAAGPLFRTTLLRLDPREHRLLFVLHHAVADARSLEILFRETAALYEGLALPELPVQYADFAAWQRARLTGPALAGLRTFWHERLRDMPPLLQLPADRPRPAVQTYRGATRSAWLSGAEELRALARAEGATSFMVLLAAFQSLVQRLTGQDDAGIGSPVSTRSRAELDGVAGFFVNTLVLRATPRNEGSFRELLLDVRRGALDAFAHADLPFETLVEELAPERSASYSPLVQVLLTLEGERVPPLTFGGLTWTAEGIDRGAAQFDLSLGIADTGDGLRASAEHSSDLFDATTVDRLLARFGVLLAAALSEPDRPLAALPLLQDAERAQLLIEWNDTAVAVDAEVPVHERIARQAERTPDAPAVEVVGRPEQSLTYRELVSRAGQLAQRLRALGVGPEVTVGICVERSADIAVGVLGVLEAGGAYLPLDPRYPADRLGFMIEDSGTPIVVTRERLRGSLPEVPVRYLYLDGGEAAPADLAPARLLPENPAYVIYTSGSTGRPKGVMVTHRSLAHQAAAGAGLVGMTPDDRMLQFASFSFDLAVEELFPTWLSGACVVFWPEAPVSGPAELTALIERERLTCAHLPPQYWHEWVVELARSQSPVPSSLRFLMVGGDTVAADRLAVWRQMAGDRVDWWNGYGPTEATVASAGYRPEAGAVLSGVTHSVPIGRPLPNERLYVVDRHGLPVPLGVPGELWIGGIGLARGYLGRPGLSAERFIPDPFGELPGERLYRTGDLVRYLPSGDLEFLGRIDSQVKVRGYRIELGEVESSLDACPMVLDAAVVLSEGRLVAYVVPTGSEVTPRELRAWLRGVLPEPMVPATFVLLPALPLSNSGKIDRRALARLTPEPDADAASGSVAPRTAVEEILTGIWAEVLGLARAGVHDHFFELGGHSLLATQVVSRIREALEVEVPLARLFESPTPAALAPFLEEAGGPVAPPIRPVARDRDLPLSFAQERLWFLDSLQPGSSAYNMVAALALRGGLSASGLEAALGEVVRRHESLRTTFTEHQGRPVQVVTSKVSWSLPRIDLSALPVSVIDGEVRRLVRDETRRPFDLERGPMLRGALLRRGVDDHVLIFDMHHIASDGWSMGVLVREVSALYGAAAPLPELPVQYADFAVWQREWLQGEVLERQMGYWRERLEGAPVLELPADRPRPAVQSFQGASVHFAISPAVTGELAALSRRHGATLFITLLAGFAALLRRLTGQDDLVVGSPVANRNRAEIEPLIGFFVNTLVLRTRLAGAPAVAGLLAEVRRTALGAYAHQDLPFERLVEELRPERHLSHNPLFQVMFALQNAPFGTIELAGLETEPLDVELPTAKFDLGLTFTEVGDGLAVELDYATDLFDAVTARRWAGYVETLLAGLAADAHVSELPLLSEPERHQLLREWNDQEDEAAAGALQRFEAQAVRTPEAEAVVFGTERLTYGQLDRKANGLARRLRALGVEPGIRVGLSVERSPALIVGLLGIWKAGGAYVPMDPAHPKARLSYMQEDAGVGVVVTQELLLEIGEEPGLGHAPASEDVAYLIYTSGTTGQPKAVVVEHRQLAATLAAVQEAFGFGPGDRMPCVAPFSFDIFLFELLGPLLAGGTSVLMPLRPTLDVERLADELESATLLHAVPALMRQVVETVRRRGGGENLRALFVGGDVVPAELLADLRETFPRADVWVLYGPTEAAIVCTAWRSDGTRSLLGRPFPGATVTVRGREGRLVPMGVPGEIWIGGAGVTRGYWRREELTAEKFVEGFFRSGDLARQLPDGTLEFLGRVDQQVKVRGFRIELGEVEAALARHAEVREAVAAVREDAGGSKQLVAYVVRRPVEVAPEEVSEHVSQWQALYEETYGRSEASDTTFDVEGWNSSYTGEPIPAGEMREWVDRTVERVLALKPRRVLEIGCGTGLLLFRIAPHVERYLGTDFSRVALDGIRRGLDGLPQVELSQRTADDWSGIPPGSFDLVVLNSVAQYFPGAEYLARVLEGAVRAVAPGGKIFVGDVRSLPLLEAMHASVELYRSPEERSVAELRRRVARRVADEEELVLGPGFFQQVPGVAGVEVLLKRGEHHNELTRFRYDVVMWVGGEEPPTCPPPLPSIPLPGGEGPLRAVERLLSGSAPDGFVLETLLNARVASEAAAVEMLSQEVETVAELRQAISERTTAGVDPEALARLAEDYGYTVKLIADPDSPFHFGAILSKSRPSPPGRGVVGSGGGQVGGSLSSLSAHANDPLRAKLARRLVPELRRFLQAELPEYMVPSAFVLLERLPVTAHGKVDRSALPEPERDRSTADLVSPRTLLEEQVAEACAEVLGLDRVGMADNFFELGGHSLLATQLVSRLRDRWGLDVPVRAVFEAPTLRDLAGILEKHAPQAEQRIPRRPAGLDPLPLSFAQERLWFLDRLQPGTAYNMPMALAIRGPLSVPALDAALSEVVRRHESLRTTFAEHEGTPVQVVAPAVEQRLPVVDLTAVPDGLRDAEVRGLLAAEAERPFDLGRGPLLRGALLRLPEEHLLLLDMHHIVSDGWSMGVLVREAAALYAAACEGRPSPLPELPVQYADFAVWQRGWLAGETLDTQLAWWRERLAGHSGVLDLPADRPRPPVQSFRGGFAPLALGTDIASGLAALAARHGATLFMALLAAFDALLQRYTGEDDLLVGTPVANRSRTEVEGLIGFFVNTLALRADLGGGPTFAGLLEQTRETALGAYAHQDLPFERLVQELAPERDLSRSPLFQVFFILQNTPLPRLELAPGLALEPAEIPVQISKFDLVLSFQETGGDVAGGAEFSSDLFDATTVHRLLAHYRTLLAAAVAHPEARLSDLPLLSPEEAGQIAQWSEGPRHVADPRATLHGLFEAQARRTPEAVALIADGGRLRYAGLEAAASRLARRLRALGAGPEVPVGLFLERSAALITAMLATSKAGGFYVPLDPEHPADRLAWMLADCPLVVTEERLAGALPPHGARVVLVDRDEDAPLAADLPPNLPTVEGEGLAYLIYTSGSTGRPKGVMVPHRAAVNHMLWMQEAFPLAAGDRVLQKTPAGFDASVWEVWSPLLAGATLVLARHGGHRDPAYLAAACIEHGITVLQVVPTLLRALLADGGLARCRTLRRLFCGGEALTADALAAFFASPLAADGTELVNLYGPTETAIQVTSWRCGPDEPALLGWPIANALLHVLDPQGAVCPVGVPGELYVGGLPVGRGYRGNPAETAARFVPDPSGEAGDRMYRTGDLVRRLPSGALEYLGRIDHQIKVRGIRVEPGEIEAALLEHADVAAAAVLVRDERLAACVVPADGAVPDRRALRAFLLERLPEAMVPSAWAFLEALPLLSNGKVDRRALAKAAFEEGAGEGHAAPRDEVEAALAAIWAGVLGIDAVGVHDDFFALGGHSLLAAQVVSRVRDAFGVEVPLATLFEAPTVAGLAGRLQREGAAPPPLVRVPRDGDLPLSFAQQRLWFLDQLNPGSPLYNVPVALRLRGPLDPAAVAASVAAVVRRHEALRTTFPAVAGQAVQRIAPELPVPVPLVDLRGLGVAAAEEGRQLAVLSARRPFDLARGPLLRASLVRLAEEEHLFLVEMHHIVSDGWSLGVLYGELATLYDGLRDGRLPELPALPVQYADFAVWQRGHLAMGDQLGWWTRRLDGATEELALPLDRPRPAVLGNAGATWRFEMPQDLSGALRAFRGEGHGTTLFMVLLAGFTALLHRYTGQDDLSLGTATAGRNRSEVEDLIGFFVNTLVLRADLSGDPGFAGHLARLRTVALEAHAHQDLPFDRLVEALRPERSLSHAPLFQAMFILQNAPGQTAGLPGLEIEAVEADSGTAKIDMVVSVEDAGERIAGSIEYSTELFDETTLARLTGHLAVLLAGAVADPATRLSDLPLLTGAEQAQLAAEWNDTETGFETDVFLHQLVERHDPGAPAVTCGGESLTYGDLNRLADDLAARLQELGVGPEVPVAVCVERSPDMLVALLGILKSGGFYVPLDPAYPDERLAAIVEDSRAAVLVTHRGLEARLPDLPVIDLDLPLSRGGGRRGGRGGRGVRALAYAIFTSGSTGRPKGVQIAHQDAVQRLETSGALLGTGPDDVWTVFHSYAFDFSVWEMWTCLSQGARLVVVPREVAQDAAAFHDLLAAEGVTVLNQTPGAMRQLVRLWEEGERDRGELALRHVLCGGEALPVDLARRLFGYGFQVWNFYGPTEVTVWATAARLHPEELEPAVPLGRPLPDTRVHLLDAGGRPVPAGVPGELCVAGVGLARGYAGRPDLTAERFVPDPLAQRPGDRLYRTGDLARRRAGGLLEYLGRIDHQVKLRGYRIELGEVEAALAMYPAVRQAAAAVAEDRLVAYVVPGGEEAPEPAGLRSWLRARLPEPMVPSAFAFLSALPLTANGKVDRRALARIEPVAAVGAGRLMPRTPAEELVAAAWSAVLGAEEVGVQDNFFDLGGHSLLATQVTSRLRDSFGVDVPLRLLFEAPVLADLAHRVEGLSRAGHGVAAPPVRRMERLGDPPLSFSQEWMWLLDRLDSDGTGLITPLPVTLRGRLDADALRRTIGEIVRRHEVLRTSFPVVEGRPVQRIALPSSLALPLVDLAALPETVRAAEAEALTAAELGRPMDVERGPLMRALLVRAGAEEHHLILALHHILFDGWSGGVLLREVGALYQAFARGEASPLPELPVQYADFAAWQRDWLQGEALEGLLGYWRGQLAGPLPVLELPGARPGVGGGRSARLPLALGPELSAAVRALARGEGVTLFVTLLAAFQTLLHRYTRQTDVVVGSSIANRHRPEIEDLIGYFVNTLVLRSDLGGDPAFRGLLARVREVTLGAYAHQDLPFTRLVEELQPDRAAGRTPLFQALFILQNMPIPDIELPGLTMTSLEPEVPISTFDLALVLADGEQGLGGWLWFNRDLLEGDMITTMLERYRVLLEGAATDPARPLSALPLVSEAERRQLLAAPGEPIRRASAPPAPPAAGDADDPDCLHRRFENRVQDDPEAVALVYQGDEVTYGDLERDANRLAWHLRELGVGPEVLVGICLDRTPEMVTAILATLKAGGAYLPLDPAYPAERLRFLLEDAGARFLVTRSDLAGKLPELPAEVVPLRLDEEAEAIARRDGAVAPRSGAGPGNAAYVIYTSGSTGRPKGVVVTHANVARLFASTEAWFRFDERDTWTLFHSYAFDFSVWEIWGALLHGGRLVIVPFWVSRAPESFHELLERERVTVLNQTPSAFAQLATWMAGADAKPPRSLRWVVFGGEALSLPGLAPWFERYGDRRPRLVNMYGITETTVHVTYRPVTVADAVSGGAGSMIGEPIPDLTVHVLDPHLEPSPFDVPGEMYVGGAGLARGYLGRPELTAERFIPDPFASAPGARLYRTGDLARRLPDGDLEYMGRADEQVKIRGFRIEPGEVEAALAAHPGVAEVVVVAREDVPGDRRLVGYVVPDAQRALPLRQLLRLEREGRLAGRATHELPNGMVVVHQHEGITASIYKEIFEGEVYRRHGVELPPGACVFDIGANMGLFTLWVGKTVPDARIFSFEPIPPTAEVLRLNAEIHGLDATVYAAGVADGERTETFTYYPFFPSTSGRFPDLTKDREDIKAHILNEQKVLARETGGFETWREEREGELDSWLDEHMKSERVSCRLTTVSSVIREHGLDRIDLLKVDAERSELDVLAGIAEEDWPKIRQMVLEVHDADIRDRVLEILATRGFEAVVEQDVYLEGTELYNVYAKTLPPRPPLPPPHAPSPGEGEMWSSPSRLTDDVRRFAMEKLPEHMVPSTLVVLDALPLTAHGKVDRRALPAPEQAARAVERQIVEPRTPVERELVDLWKELLGVERVSIYDNFFELGGHSLLLTQLASRIRSTFQVEVPLRILFDVPNVVEMTAAIAERQAELVSHEEMSEMLDELKGLSPEEIKALLEAEG